MYIIMDGATATLLTGMYNGSYFEPMRLSNGMFACTIDNLYNPAFVSIHNELRMMETVNDVELWRENETI